MKVVILAGGLGTRLGDETLTRPKPMVEIGEQPIVLHLMRWFAHFGHTEFVLALGYKAHMIKEWFQNFVARNSSLTIDLATGMTTIHDGERPSWTVHLVDTGLTTQTGGRFKRVKDWVADGTFLATYGDGLADVDLAALLEFHRAHGQLATVTAVRPPARFGALHFDGDRISGFLEKPQTTEGWINGGFFVLEPAAIDYVESDETIWERGPMEQLTHDRQLFGYRHHGFFQPMDTPRDKRQLEDVWATGQAPWTTR